ncbi:MAG: peptidylprolyl isomerase [Candidatus Binatia bacterium]
MKTHILLLFIGGFGWALQSQAEVINRVVATVDDEPITLRDIRTFGKSTDGQQNFLVPPQGVAGMSEKDILEVLIMNKLIGKEVETQGLTAKESDIDSYIERIKRQGNLDDAQLKEALAAQGMTLEAYRKQVGEEIERALLINREIGSRVNVTPQDVERYYEEHGGGGASPDSGEQVRVRHIFLPLSPTASSEEEKALLDQAEDIRKRALAGENFATLADTYSRGPGAGQGGDLGFFKRGQMTKDIEEVAFALQPGDVSQPFRNDAGVHLIKVEEHLTEGEQAKKGLDPETAEQIKQKLYNEALQERYQRWFQEDLRFRHQVENFLTASSSSGTSNFTFKSARKKAEPTSPPEAPEEQKGFFRRLLPF